MNTKLKSMLNTFILGNVVLGTLQDVSDGFPESTIYLALGSNYDLSMKLLGMLEDQKAISRKSHWITKGANYDVILKKCIDGEAAIKKLCQEKGIVL